MSKEFPLSGTKMIEKENVHSSGKYGRRIDHMRQSHIGLNSNCITFMQALQIMKNNNNLARISTFQRAYL